MKTDNIHIPFHQFEIRFLPLIDFRTFSRSLISPYIKLVQKINIQNLENGEERFMLLLDRNRSISLQYDRLFFTGEGLHEDVLEKNSSVQNIILRILEKLEARDGFGGYNNALFFSIVILTSKNPEFDGLNAFQKMFIVPDSESFIEGYNDIALVFEKFGSDSNIEESVKTGPFTVHDISKVSHIANYSRVDELRSQMGVMADLKQFRVINDFDFKIFENFNNRQWDWIGKLQKVVR